MGDHTMKIIFLAHGCVETIAIKAQRVSYNDKISDL